jgi:hypothetical protein
VLENVQKHIMECVPVSMETEPKESVHWHSQVLRFEMGAFDDKLRYLSNSGHSNSDKRDFAAIL